ncbi:MAG TPA: DUF2844 domain-containing protein [Steroidobacteraceae bacterium]|nr:DUF2844 domain-containing protein [Steroidobacteraceae bacterium]
MQTSIPARVTATAAIGLAVLWSHASCAGLGEPVGSIATDETALHATALAVTPAQSYDVHDLTMSGGASIREYATRAGMVFAVTWSGRGMPDLSVLLGGYYADYLRAANRHASRKIVSIATAGLVLHIVKLPRGFLGAAYVPALIPAGTSPQDIR